SGSVGRQRSVVQRLPSSHAASVLQTAVDRRQRLPPNTAAKSVLPCTARSVTSGGWRFPVIALHETPAFSDPHAPESEMPAKARPVASKTASAGLNRPAGVQVVPPLVDRQKVSVATVANSRWGLLGSTDRLGTGR